MTETTEAKQQDAALLEEKRQATWGSGTKDTSQQKFVCDVCGKEFPRPQSLGAHKKGAHGIAGTSKEARIKRNKRQGNHPVAVKETFDTDRLLADLFPTGIPARKETLDAVTGWLAEAERLSKMR